MELTRPFFVFISMNKMGLVPNSLYLFSKKKNSLYAMFYFDL